MAIVMTIDHGPGKGIDYIDDSCVVKTKEEVEQIRRNCGEIAFRDYLKKEHMRRKQEKKQIE